MRTTRLKAALAGLVLSMVITAPLVAQDVPSIRISGSSLNTDFYPDYGQDVQAVNADPSPSAYRSHVNNYLFQDEQINVTPDDGTLRVLRTDQKNLVQEYVTKAFPVRNADVSELLGVFRTVTGKEGGRAEAIRDKVEGAYFIQVIAPEWQIPFIERAIAALDEAWVSEYSDGSVDYYYYPQFREAALVDRIASQWGGTLGGSVVDVTNNAIFRQDEQYRIEQYQVGAKFADIPEHMINLEGAIYELNLSNDLKLGLDYIAWKNGPGRNLFTFLFGGHEAGETFRAASSLYNPFLTGSAGGGRVIDGVVDGDGDLVDSSRRYESRSEQEYYAANFLLTSAYFDFLQSKGKAKVLARPNVTTRSGTVGTWASADQIVAFEAADIIDPLEPMIDENLTTNPGYYGTRPDRLADQPGFGSGGGARLIGGEGQEALVSRENGGYGDLSVSPRTLRYKNAGQTGLFLSILPLIGTETTELTVDFAQADLNGYTPQGMPILTTRTYVTTVRVADGQPLAVGGVRRSEDVKFKQGAPFLSSIPVLGWAFGGETRVDRDNDIAMVLMPRIYTAAESDMEMPKVMSMTMAQATGEAEAKVPSNPLGFDQWLLENLDR